MRAAEAPESTDETAYKKLRTAEFARTRKRLDKKPVTPLLLRVAAADEVPHRFAAPDPYDLDRFGRNARQTMLALNTLADLGISIWDYSTGQAVDLDTFEGEISTFLRARFAQSYRDSVRKHTKAAMRAKAQAGFRYRRQNIWF
jgi:Resolvase, N terminal domain